MMWLPMKLPGGKFRVGRLVNGAVQYVTEPDGVPTEFPLRQAARRKAERLNVGELPSRCTEAELADLVRGSHVRDKMMLALRLLLVEGATWRRAAEQSCVTESGILRALRRLVSRRIDP